MRVSPAAELSIIAVDHRRHGRAARALDGRAGPHRRHVVPDGRAGRGVPAARRVRPWARRCSATSCCARSSPRRRRASAGHSLDDELHLLTVHGVLHLLGYDHAEPDEEREMFALQATLLADWRRSRSAAAARAAQRRSDSAVLGTVGLDDTMIAPLLVVAVLLVPVAGLFAAADAALNSVSRAHVESLVREGTPGARALAKVVADRPRHVNLLLLLRLAAETTATVLVTVAFVQIFATPWVGALVAAGVMVVVSYVFIGVGPRTLGRQHPYRIGMVLAAPGAGAGHPARAAVAAAHRDRQRGHARAGLPGGPVLVRDRAARAGRHGQHVRRRRRGRAPDDPLGVRAGRHDRPRRHGAPPRRRVDRARHTRREGRAARAEERLLAAAGARRGHRRHRRRRLPQGPRAGAGRAPGRPAWPR